MKLGYEVAADAYAAFDAWLAQQPIEVQDLDLLEQIDVYAKSEGGSESMTSHTIHADRFEIKDPATGKVIASSDMSVAELERVLASGAAGPGADWVAQMIEGKREAK